EELDHQRWQLIRQLLPNAIDTKLAYLDFLRTVPSDRMPEVFDQIYRQYDQHQLPLAMERAQVATIAELDAKRREFGSSLAKERQAFAEQVLAREMIRNNLNPDEEVSHEELVRYYQEHLDEYSYKERV